MSFKVCLCDYRGSPHHKTALQAFRAGLERHGIRPVEFTPDCDLAVFWSHNAKPIIEHQRRAGKDYLVMERGYIGDRMQWTSLGFNGLNGRAEFHAEDSPGDRWDRHFGPEWLKPWKEGGDYVLLIGQVPGDASVKHSNHFGWLQWMANQIAFEYPGVPIRHRPHPINVRRRALQPIDGTEMSTRPLAEDLAGAICAVTFCSNTGVDALLAGTPVVAFDPGSMVWGMGPDNVQDPPRRPDRTQWAWDMAYKQWTWPEIESGTAWDHLRQRFE